MIDRYLLRYFLAVIDEGNFSRAAERCNVSQPTLSVGIAKLERLLDRPLFNRDNRRVALTPEGVELATRARRIEAEFQAAEQVRGAQRSRRTLRLGMLHSIPRHWFAEIARLCGRAGGDLRVEFVEGRERDLLERLGRGRLDIALTLIRTGDSRFPTEPLLTESYALAMAENHPLAARIVIEPEELAGEVMIVRRHCEALAETSRHFTQRGVRPFFAARTYDEDRAMLLVQSGVGITVMPDCFAAPGVTRPRLAGFEAERTVGIVYASADIRDELANSPLVEALRGTAASQPGQDGTGTVVRISSFA